MAQSGRPTHVLWHFLPAHIIEHARQLSRSFQRDELFRVYVLKRMWFVVPAGFLFAAVSFACALGTYGLLFQLLRNVQFPIPSWMSAVALLACLVVFFFANLSQLYVLFSWLEERASRAGALDPVHASAVPHGQLHRTRRDRVRSSLLLIVVFVVTPLIALGVAFPSLGLMLVMVGIFMPIVYTLFDRR